MISCHFQNGLTNNLRVNIEKTVNMIFRNKKTKLLPPVNLSINGEDISTVTTTKLGMHIQENLKSEVHLKNLNSKLSSMCYAFRILLNVVNQNVQRCAYFANIYSHLRYGIIF